MYRSYERMAFKVLIYAVSNSLLFLKAQITDIRVVVYSTELYAVSVTDVTTYGTTAEY